jgi:uncharacterized protein
VVPSGAYRAAAEAIQHGDVAALMRLLDEHPELATMRITRREGLSVCLVHALTDWPRHFPHGPSSLRALVEAGADVNAHLRGPSRGDGAIRRCEQRRRRDDRRADRRRGGYRGARSRNRRRYAARRRCRVRAVAGCPSARRARRPDGALARCRPRLDGPGRSVLRRYAAALEGRRRRELLAGLPGGSMPPPNTCLPGGEPELGGYDDRTPLDMAVRSGAGDLVEWLAAQGAKSSSDLGGTSEATGQPLTGTADAAEEGRVCAG